MSEILLYFVLSTIIGGIGAFIVFTVTTLNNEPNTHIWPSITRCRLCNKRVCVWQYHEHRAINTKITGNTPLNVEISASSIVHRSCKGTPNSTVDIRKTVTQDDEEWPMT